METSSYKRKVSKLLRNIDFCHLLRKVELHLVIDIRYIMSLLQYDGCSGYQKQSAQELSRDLFDSACKR